MIQCPKCSATLPDWSKTCQFCQADTSSVARQAQPKPSFVAVHQGTPQWIWGAYYGLSVLYVVEGVYDIVMAFVNSHQKFMGEEVGFGVFSVVSVIIGLVTILVGLGLLLRIEQVRGIVNFFCGIQILFGILGLAGSVMGALFTGPLGLIGALSNVLGIATAVFMMYLIGETDRTTPDF